MLYVKLSFRFIGFLCIVFVIGMLLVSIVCEKCLGLVYNVDGKLFLWVSDGIMWFCVVLVSSCSVWYMFDLLLLFGFVMMLSVVSGMISLCSEW